MQFSDIKQAVAARYESMQGHRLFRTQVEKDLLWDTYLASFPAGSNPTYRERTEHDCSCCKQFIRAVGNMVTIEGGKLVSIWDIEIGGPYQVVANAMSKLVKSAPIDNIFISDQIMAGVDRNYEQTAPECAPIEWQHFYLTLPRKNVLSGDDIGTKLSESRAAYDVFTRGMQEINIDSLDTVLDLATQKTLYRGEENHFAVLGFKKLKEESKAYNGAPFAMWCWEKSISVPPAIARLRNTAIGTLLINLSEGMALDTAVGKYEAIVAPSYYKRPTALITKGMIDKAQKKVAELGIEGSLSRRYAVIDDITINNVLFADREAKESMGVFDDLQGLQPVNIQSLEKVEVVEIDRFIKDILPTATSMELLFDNSQTGNLFSLVAPQDAEAPPIFKWHNNFSWSYLGELTDSVKERVKNAGGDVDGDFRASLSWFNFDDLDLHIRQPNGEHIYFSRKQSSYGGGLDVDMNANRGNTRSAVENITYPNRNKMQEGRYQLYVNQYCPREKKDMGFDCEIEFDGVVHNFSYDKGQRNGENVTVAEFDYSHTEGIKFVSGLSSSHSSKEMWGISTQQFHKVRTVMFSPNHWDEKTQGNKHFFFVLDGCANPEDTRGFYNEFLKPEMNEHRKVFEVLGRKLRAPHSDEQLSGLGFSSTQRNVAYMKVSGSFNRTIKLIF